MQTLLQTIVTGLSDATLYVMLSVSLTLILGVLGLFNFAQGDFSTVAAYIGIAAISGLGLSSVGSLAVMVPALALLGVAFYAVFVRPTQQLPHENQLLATFGLAFILQGAVAAIWGPDPVSAKQATGAVVAGSVVLSEDFLRNLAVAAIAVIILWQFLARTRAGLEIRATAQDPVGAELIGVRTGRARFLATVLGCALSAVGGLMLLTTSYVFPQVGFGVILTAFAVVILGGLGSVAGAVWASVLLGLATSLVATYVDAAVANIVPFAVMIVVLLARPQGLLGRAAA